MTCVLLYSYNKVSNLPLIHFKPKTIEEDDEKFVAIEKRNMRIGGMLPMEWRMMPWILEWDGGYMVFMMFVSSTWC